MADEYKDDDDAIDNVTRKLMQAVDFAWCATAIRHFYRDGTLWWTGTVAGPPNRGPHRRQSEFDDNSPASRKAGALKPLPFQSCLQSKLW
jgi:hypothetical protein